MNPHAYLMHTVCVRRYAIAKFPIGVTTPNNRSGIFFLVNNSQ